MRVVVVGASTGLGRCLGIGLAQRGASVALLARREEFLEKIAPTPALLHSLTAAHRSRRVTRKRRNRSRPKPRKVYSQSHSHKA